MGPNDFTNFRFRNSPSVALRLALFAKPGRSFQGQYFFVFLGF